MLGRQTLQRSGPKVQGPACYSASAFLQNILERHLLKAGNASLAKLRSGELGADDPRLAQLARRASFITK